MLKRITLAVIGLAVIGAVIWRGVIPAPYQEPAWVSELKAASLEAVKVGEEAELLARDLYDAKPVSAVKRAEEILRLLESAAVISDPCLEQVALARQEYYMLLEVSSVMVLEVIPAKDWDALIPVGETLLEAEGAASRLVDSVLAHDPNSCS